MLAESGPNIVQSCALKHVEHNGTLSNSHMFSHEEKLCLISARDGGACIEVVGGISWHSGDHILTLTGLCIGD